MYRDDHRLAILQQKKEHYDRYLAPNVTCKICGITYTNGSLWHHKRSKRHLTALFQLNNSILELGPQYQQQLDEALSAHKETCKICGGLYYEGFSNRHNKTKGHLAALAGLITGSESNSETSQIKDYNKKKDKMQCFGSPQFAGFGRLPPASPEACYVMLYMI